MVERRRGRRAAGSEPEAAEVRPAGAIARRSASGSSSSTNSGTLPGYVHGLVVGIDGHEGSDLSSYLFQRFEPGKGLRNGGSSTA
jgi:hypothetical protein